jgi:hypothetical protein
VKWNGIVEGDREGKGWDGGWHNAGLEYEQTFKLHPARHCATYIAKLQFTSQPTWELMAYLTNITHLL